MKEIKKKNEFKDIYFNNKNEPKIINVLKKNI